LSQFQYWQFKFAEYATQLENARNRYVKAALSEDKQRWASTPSGSCAPSVTAIAARDPGDRERASGIDSFSLWYPTGAFTS